MCVGSTGQVSPNRDVETAWDSRFLRRVLILGTVPLRNVRRVPFPCHDRVRNDMVRFPRSVDLRCQRGTQMTPTHSYPVGLDFHRN